MTPPPLEVKTRPRTDRAWRAHRITFRVATTCVLYSNASLSARQTTPALCTMMSTPEKAAPRSCVARSTAVYLIQERG